MMENGESGNNMKMSSREGLAVMVAIVVALAAVLALAAVPMQPSDGAASGKCSENGALVWELNDEGVLTIVGEGYMEDYYYGHSSYESGPWGDAVTKVVAGDGVRSIGEYAFSGCSALESVEMPAVEFIAESAFSGCSALESVEMPSVVLIGSTAFEDCRSLREVSMPASVEYIGGSAFDVVFSGPDGNVLAQDAESLRGHVYRREGDGVLAYDERPCGDGLYWTLDDDGVLTIAGNGYMYDYESYGPWGDAVRKVVAGDGVRSIGNCAFRECSALVSVTMTSVETIGDYAFSDCSSLREIDIPSSVVSVGDGAFYGKEFCGPNGIKLTQDAESLRGHIYRAGADAYLRQWDRPCGDGLFWTLDDDGVLTISGEGYMDDYHDYESCGPWGDAVTKVVAGDGVRSIGDWAFSGCSSLESVTMSSVETIGDNAFSGCSSLREIDIPSSVTSVEGRSFNGLVFCDSEGNTLSVYDLDRLRGHVYTGEGDGVLAHHDRYCGDTLYWNLDGGVLTIFGEGYMYDYESCGPWGQGVREVVTGEGVRLIGNNAFRGCSSLVSVEMPAVRSIGDSAFCSCSSLVSVSMPEVKIIGSNAFDICPSLCWISIPASVVYIGDWAFEAAFFDLEGNELDKDAESLRGHVYHGEGDERLVLSDGSCGDGLRWTVDSAGVLTIAGEGYMDDYESCGPWGDRVTKIVASDGVKSIGNLAFYECNHLSYASIPGVQHVGDYAFRGCVLRFAEMPSAESVGASAFRNCSFLEYASLPSAAAIGDNAFRDCPSLESVEMPLATTIGYRAFYYCTSLESVDMPLAETLGGGAFYGCSSLAYVDMGCVVDIGGTAFTTCDALKRVYLPYSLESLGDYAFSSSMRFLDEDGNVLAQDAESLRGYVYKGAGDWTLTRQPYLFAHDGVRYRIIGDGAALAVGYEGKPVSLAVPDAVPYRGSEYVPVAVSEGAFSGCGTLETITIGSAVAAIGEGALDAPMLRSVEVSAENGAYSSDEGVLYDKGANVLLKFPASKQRLVIPVTVTEIAPHAFENAGSALKGQYQGGDVSYFRYVAIPASVERIGEYAFSGSTLECLKFTGGEVSVGDHAFAGCSALNYVVFLASFTDVGDHAFDGCVFYDGETEMALGDAMAGHKFTSETGSSGLRLYVPKPGGTIVSGDVKYRITSNGGAKTVTAVRIADAGAASLDIPASISYLGFDWTVTSIASKAFMGNGSLESVSSAVDVGYRSFSGCAKLSKVELKGASSVGAYAFSVCKALESVSDDGHLESIGTSAFSGCSSLSAADLSNVVTVGKHAFFGCALAKADLSSATSIGYGAFTGNHLGEVLFGYGLQSVDPKAFFRYSFKDADGARIAVAASGLAGKSFAGAGKVLCQTA